MKQIANFLKNFREKKGLTKEDIIQNTTLTKGVIHLIESGDFKSIGAQFYIKSFLRQYCKAIGLTEQETEEIVSKVINGLNSESINPAITHKKGNFIGFFIVIALVLIILALFFFIRRKGNGFNEALASQKSHLVKTQQRIQKTSRVKKQNPEVKNLPKGKLEGKPETKPSSIKKEIEDSKKNGSEIINKDYEKDKLIKVKFEADCMCWVNIQYKDKTLKDFILKQGENLSLTIPEGATLSIGNARCLRLFFNDREIKLGEEKVIKGIVVE